MLVSKVICVYPFVFYAVDLIVASPRKNLPIWGQKKEDCPDCIKSVAFFLAKKCNYAKASDLRKSLTVTAVVPDLHRIALFVLLLTTLFWVA